MAQQELLTLVLYDIPHDRTRTKVSDRCGDFGLVRFQYSAFQGPLTRNRREELALALESLIEVYGGLITIFPLCAADTSQRVDLYVEPPVIEQPVLKVYRGDDNGDSAVATE
jgi:CRISPR-associated protein Cas2